MHGKVMVFVFAMVLMATLTAFFVEMFVPLKKKIDFNDVCRKALMKMEVNNSLDADTENDLRDALAALNFSNINITSTQNAKKGDDINLNVTADFVTRRIAGLFHRDLVTYPFAYNKTTVARKVVN